MGNFFERIARKLTTNNYTGSEGKVDVNKRFHMEAPTSYRNFQRGDEIDGKKGLYTEGNSWIAGGKEVGLEENIPTSGKTYVPRASSAIATVDYDPKTTTASVRYVGGNKSYDFNVTPDQMQQFISAPSKGRWVQHIWKKYNRKAM